MDGWVGGSVGREMNDSSWVEGRVEEGRSGWVDERWIDQ